MLGKKGYSSIFSGIQIRNFIAAYNNHTKTVKVLLRNLADVNCVNKNGNTALICGIF